MFAIGLNEIEMFRTSVHSGNSRTVVPNLVSDFFYGTCNYLISNPAKNRISPVWVGGSKFSVVLRGLFRVLYCIKKKSDYERKLLNMSRCKRISKLSISVNFNALFSLRSFLLKNKISEAKISVVAAE